MKTCFFNLKIIKLTKHIFLKHNCFYTNSNGNLNFQGKYTTSQRRQNFLTPRARGKLTPHLPSRGCPSPPPDVLPPHGREARAPSSGSSTKPGVPAPGTRSYLSQGPHNSRRGSGWTKNKSCGLRPAFKSCLSSFLRQVMDAPGLPSCVIS